MFIRTSLSSAKNKMARTLVLFDFDGTITTGDTFPLFLMFAKGKPATALIFARYLPHIALYFVKLMDGETLKRNIFGKAFYDEKKERLEETGKAFVESLYEKKIIKSDFLEKIRAHKKNGADVYVVSASIDVWVAEFCRRENIGCICTELDYTNDVFKGQFKTKNCNGAEKAVRIKQACDLSRFEKIIAFGNSSGDKEMFALSTEHYLV